MPKKNAIDIDYSKDFEIAYKEIREKAEKGMLSIALEELFSWEKKTRSGGDFTTCGHIAREIVKICKDFNEWKQLNESLLLLSKRRGQATTVIAEAVKQGMEYIQQRDENTMELIKTLRTISEGKMYLEIESAELTRTLAKYQEQDGEIKLAAKTLQETQVETLAKMGKDKKIDYILEQVRLCLDAKDFTRAIIIGRKINTNNIAQDDALNPLKIRYYTLMIRYHYQEKDYLSIAKAYQAIYNTASVLANESEWTKYLKLTSIYAILSPYGNEQNDLINRTFLLKNLKEIPTFRALVKLFLTYELIRFDDIVARFLPELNEFSEFSEAERDILHLRVCEHNLRVIAKYYTRISFKRLCSLLDLPIELVEKRLSDLVVTGSVYAKIDRPSGVINFSKPRKSEEVLNDWSHNISELLNLLEKTCHLIQRENMVFESKTL